MDFSEFKQQHPQIRQGIARLHDLDGLPRDSVLTLEDAATAYRDGVPLPGTLLTGQSTTAPAASPIDSIGLGLDLDALRPCRALPHTLQAAANAAVWQVSMFEPDGRPFFGDPRHALVKVLDRFHRLNLTPQIRYGSAVGADALESCDAALATRTARASIATLDLQITITDPMGANALDATLLQHALAGVRALRRDGTALLHADAPPERSPATLDIAHVALAVHGVDARAQPYLVTAWILAGMHLGIAESGRLAPSDPAPLDDALAILEASDVAAAYLGRPFRDLYVAHRRRIGSTR
ncbi:MAG: hypothetical protein ACO3A8_01525 [Steroidobacteraceae bacterium]|jgi:hypothetical protein